MPSTPSPAPSAILVVAAVALLCEEHSPKLLPQTTAAFTVKTWVFQTHVQVYYSCLDNSASEHRPDFSAEVEVCVSGCTGHMWVCL